MSTISELIDNYRRFSNRKRLAAVQDDDLETLLSSLGILDQLTTGQINCTHCGSSIRIGNLAGWVKTADRLLVFCDKPECLVEAPFPHTEVNNIDG